MTNGDRMRMMTDDELAGMMIAVHISAGCPEGYKGCGIPLECKKCWLKWLKQEVSND